MKTTVLITLSVRNVKLTGLFLIIEWRTKSDNIVVKCVKRLSASSIRNLFLTVSVIVSVATRLHIPLNPTSSSIVPVASSNFVNYVDTKAHRNAIVYCARYVDRSAWLTISANLVVMVAKEQI